MFTHIVSDLGPIGSYSIEGSAMFAAECLFKRRKQATEGAIYIARGMIREHERARRDFTG